MSTRRIVSLTPVSPGDYARLQSIAVVAADRKNAEDDWPSGEELELPRSGRWSLMRRYVWAEKVFSFGSITAWLTCEGELWWRYELGWEGREVFERFPDDADAGRAHELVVALTREAFAA